jgi:hypothetical protein
VNKYFRGTAILGSLLLVTACTANWKLTASCDTTKKCQVGGEIGGPVGPIKRLLASAMMATTTVPDAAQFYIDTTGSTVAYPATGTVTITLIDSTTGSVQAAKLFGWTRYGNQLKLTDPNAVNTWASAYGNADSMKYSLTRFQSNYGIGNQTIAVASNYEGSVTATSSSTFYSCTKPGVYSPQLCSGGN